MKPLFLIANFDQDRARAKKPDVAPRMWVCAGSSEMTNLKGVSRMKLHRDISATRKTARYMLNRIREGWYGRGRHGNGGGSANCRTKTANALFGRMIRATANNGDLVLVPFCGCGTTVEVAHGTDGRWIGVDTSGLAVDETGERPATYGRCPKRGCGVLDGRPDAMAEGRSRIASMVSRIRIGSPGN